MSKTVKTMVTDDLRNRYRDVQSACVVDLTGLNVQEQQVLRAALRARSGRLEVMRNSMARRAFQDGPLEPLGSALVGPCALVTGSESVIELAKALVEAAQEFTQLKLKHAIMEGVPELLTVEILSKMKSQRDLIAEVAQLIGSPARALAGCLASPQSRIAGCLKALVERAA